MSGDLLAWLTENEPDFRRARLPALYSDFTPQRTLNPDGYAANVSAWKRGLASALLQGHSTTTGATVSPSKSGNAKPASSAPGNGHFVLSLSPSLLRSLESKQFGQPLALGAVLAEAVSAGEMLPVSKFMSATESICASQSGASTSAAGWVVSLSGRALRWGLTQAGILSPGPDADTPLPRGEFVVLSNLERGAALFEDALAAQNLAAGSRFDRTFSRPHFCRTMGKSLLPDDHDQALTDRDFDVLIRFLARDKGRLATDTHSSTIRIRLSSDLAHDPEGPHISHEDTAIAHLRALMADLAVQTDVLSARITALDSSARDAVAAKNRVAALAALKSKKRAEDTLKTRFAALHSLEDVAAKLQTAADNVALAGVMKSSAAALRGLNAQVGSAEAVAEVVDGLREQMGVAEEIGETLASEGGVVVDEAELDAELEGLVRAEREAVEAREAEELRDRLTELDELGVGTLPTEEGKEKEKEKEKEGVLEG